jgi:hypothetical protein
LMAYLDLKFLKIWPIAALHLAALAILEDR